MTTQNHIETRLAELLKTIQDSEQWQVATPATRASTTHLSSHF